MTNPYTRGSNAERTKGLLVGLLGCAAISTALAQTPAEAQTSAEAQTPEESALGVVVADAGNRVIYTAEYFSQYSVVTASDQLERVPGIQDLGGGGGGGDQRGFGSSGDQILINGQRVSGKSNDVGSVLDRIQARQVVQIEVIRGAVPGLDVRSQGRVVNVVLEDTLSTGYGSVSASVEHYSEGSPGASGEVSYNGDLGAINYLVSLEGDVRKYYSEGLDLFYTPANVLFERQSENSQGKSDEITFSSNTSYAFLNGGVLNLNALYADEGESGSEVSNEYEVIGGSEFFDGGQLQDETGTSRDWEIGGDYQHLFANGNTLTTLFIYSHSSSNEEGSFSFIPAGGVAELDDVQLEDSVSVEKIVRSSYQWSLGTNHLFESGAELAINTVEEDASLLENNNGTLVEVPLFNEESTIEETRYEVFTSYSWQASEKLLLESSLDLEFSELQQRGNDVERSRDFFYPRPRLALRYDLTEQTQLRGRIERTISQLDFSSFVASFTNDDNRFDVINAGNPELEPEKTWEYELSYERQLLNDMGVFSVTAQYSDVTDYIGRIPLLVQTPNGIRTRTAPGNLGDGYSAELEISSSLRLDWLNLEGGVLDLSLEFQKSSIEDPFTGEEREFNFSSDYEWSLAYRQDVDWYGLSFGLETRYEAPLALYDMDYWQEMENEIDAELFVQMQPFDNTTLRLEAENLLRSENQRERFQYIGNRGNTPLERRELRTSPQAREIAVSISWAF